VDRPNRFLLRCRLPGAGVVDAFLPNPGRLWELLFPGTVVYVTAAPRGAQPRKTGYTVLAVERDGAPILLHTHLANTVARWLVDRRMIPGLEDARVLRAEVPVARSRFDFLLRRGSSEAYMEVKACTLYGNGVAMFPDAITERGRRHLVELSHLGTPAARPVVLILVQTPRVRWFMPDYHTDLAFSETFLRVRDRVHIMPVSVGWNEDLSLRPQVTPLEVPWDYLKREVHDRGSYLLILRVPRPRRVQVGKLGAIRFRPGYYVYVGSAMGRLTPRIARHLRTRKNKHWHIDYLRDAADRVVPVPIRSSQRLECAIAAGLAGLLEPGPDRFGSSDCACPTHLFRCDRDPLHLPAFHELLQHFRMRPPE